jgi:hypothetical protein
MQTYNTPAKTASEKPSRNAEAIRAIAFFYVPTEITLHRHFSVILGDGVRQDVPLDVYPIQHLA